MAWTYVATVESDSEPGRTYAIRRAGTGRLGCDCLRYRFARGEKTCKHLAAYLAGERMDADRAVKPAVRVERARVTHAAETFTITIVRRAIAFGEVR